MIPSRPLMDKILTLIRKPLNHTPPNCWIWIGPNKYPSNTPKVHYRGNTYSNIPALLVATQHPFPFKMKNWCKNKLCVNPDHYEVIATNPFTPTKTLRRSRLNRYHPDITHLKFVADSNAIEGITRTPFQEEINEHRRFINLPPPHPTLKDLIQFVHVYEPSAQLRDQPNLNVRIGNHTPPPGGPDLVDTLTQFLATMPQRTPYSNHIQYERLHPFTDCNGRSGRVLWAWQTNSNPNPQNLSFLHAFYYQTLSQPQKDKS